LASRYDNADQHRRPVAPVAGVLSARRDHSPKEDASPYSVRAADAGRSPSIAIMTGQIESECVHGVVGVLKEEARYLLIQRSAAVLAPGMWCFPGGAIEPGETPAQAIVREMREEVGLVVEPVDELWSWLCDDGSLHLRWWKVVRLGGRLRPNPAEVQAVRWMTAAEMRRQEGMAPNNIGFLDHYEPRQEKPTGPSSRAAR
jgi:8-oxo-dGTP diphosphatase